MSPALGPGGVPTASLAGAPSLRSVANDGHQHQQQHAPSAAAGPHGAQRLHLSAAAHPARPRHASQAHPGRPASIVAGAVAGERQSAQSSTLGLGPLPVHITDRMDSGNIIVDRIEGDSVELKIRMDPFTEVTDKKEHAQWFYFRASNVKGRPMTFSITNCKDCSFPDAWDGYQTVASYDCVNWFRVQTTSYSEDTGTLSWTVTPEQGTMWFAYFAPYSYERHQEFVSRCAQHPAAELSVLGTTLDMRPLDLLTIGHGPLNVWVIARQHPGESMAEWYAEGLVQRLLKDQDAQAKATFHVVPNMNPDGSVRGYLRTNAGGANLNREWADSGSYKAPTLERSPEVYYVLKSMDETGVDLFLDIHGDEAIPGNFWAGFEGVPGVSPELLGLYEDFKSAMVKASPDFQVEQGYPDDEPGEANLAVCSNQVTHRYGCIALTFEQPFKDCWNNPEPIEGWSPARAQRLGSSTIDAVLDIVPELQAQR